MFKVLLKKYWLLLLGLTLGAVEGYLYWAFVGRESGTWLITSSPVGSTLLGAVLSGLFFSMFTTRKE